MYDYKFRQEELSFRRSRHRFRRIAVTVFLFFLVTGVLYVLTGYLNLGSEGSGGSEGSEGSGELQGDPNIIPLRLPPKRATRLPEDPG